MTTTATGGITGAPSALAIKTGTPELVSMPGWLARTPAGMVEGYRLARYDAERDAYEYTGRAFTKRDERHARTMASLGLWT